MNFAQIDKKHTFSSTLKADPTSKINAYASINVNKHHSTRSRSSVPSTPSLPSLAQKDQKVNVLRHQIDETKNQMITIQARINALKWQKKKHQKKQHNNKSQIQFIRTVRERSIEDKIYKESVRENKSRQEEYLKKQANDMKEKMKREKEESIILLNQKKQNQANLKRIQQKKDEQFINKVRTLELLENQNKVNSIRQSEKQIQNKLKQFNMSRISFAQQNHQQRVQRSLSEKQKLDKKMNKLRRQQRKLAQQCKKSQTVMFQSLYELEGLNPQKKRRKSIQIQSPKQI